MASETDAMGGTGTSNDNQSGRGTKHGGFEEQRHLVILESPACVLWSLDGVFL